MQNNHMNVLTDIMEKIWYNQKNPLSLHYKNKKIWKEF